MSPPLEGSKQSNDAMKPAKPATNPNIDTYLMVADDRGHCYFYLDGSYPLGPVSLQPGPETTLSSLSLASPHTVFLTHWRVKVHEETFTELYPSIIRLPLLATRSVRDLAQLSSTARELVWYLMRVVKEMRVAWFGSENFAGVREIGPKWIRALESRQKDKFGRECCRGSSGLSVTVLVHIEDDPNPLLDLTSLLITGRGSDALMDFLGTGEQMSERVSDS
jgi:anaphase-promoting complex subunit 4